MYTLEFNQTDLDANRQGSLSEAQRERIEKDVAMLKRQNKYAVWFYFAMVIFLGGFGFVNEYNNAHQDLSVVLSPAHRVGFAIAATMFAVVMVLVVGWMSWTTRRYSQGHFRSVEGKVHVVDGVMSMRGVNVPVYNLEVRRGWFSKTIFRFQSSASLRYFRDGKRYRVYYLPYALPQALSAEQLENA